MAIRRLSISSSKLPRYVALPTRDKYDDPTTHNNNNNNNSNHNNNSHNDSHHHPTASSSTSLADSNELLSSSSSSSYHPPSPSSTSRWSNSLSSSISRLNRYLRFIFFSLVELGPTEKILTHFRPRRFLIIVLLTSLLSIVLLLLSFPLVPPKTFPSISQWWSSNWGRLDREELFRWNSIYYQSDSAIVNQKQIPFLLNRFGYQSSLPSNHAYSNPEPIPSILHVVPPGKGVFSYLQWLSISSGVKQIRPKRTIAHVITGTLPPPGSNFWWDEVMRLPGFEVNQVPDPHEIFGNPILDISHKSDVIRLRALQDHGGVYIDTDVIVLRPFDELMTGDEEVVMGVEKADGTFQTPVEINGLCNAVIVSKKGSNFLKTWWENYRTFRGKPFRGGGVWNYHSVKLPWALAKNASASATPITVLDHTSFFTPLWDDPALKWVHGTLKQPAQPPSPPAPVPPPSRPQVANPEGTDDLPPPSSRFRMTLAELRRPLSSEYQSDETVDVEKLQHGELAADLPGFALESTGQYAYHMWHHLLDERISIATDGLLRSASDLTPEDCLNRDSSFNRVAKKYLTPAVLKRYWEFKRQNKSELSDSSTLKTTKYTSSSH